MRGRVGISFVRAFEMQWIMEEACSGRGLGMPNYRLNFLLSMSRFDFRFFGGTFYFKAIINTNQAS